MLAEPSETNTIQSDLNKKWRKCSVRVVGCAVCGWKTLLQIYDSLGIPERRLLVENSMHYLYSRAAFWEIVPASPVPPRGCVSGRWFYGIRLTGIFFPLMACLAVVPNLFFPLSKKANAPVGLGSIQSNCVDRPAPCQKLPSIAVMLQNCCILFKSFPSTTYCLLNRRSDLLCGSTPGNGG